MSNFRHLFNKVSEVSDLYFISLIILYLLKDTKEYSLLSELTFILDKDSFVNLLKYYEGEEIKIPDREELVEVFTIILFYYYYDIKEMEWKDIFKKLEIEYTVTKSNTIKGKLNWLRRVMKKVQIPNEKNLN